MRYPKFLVVAFIPLAITSCRSFEPVSPSSRDTVVNEYDNLFANMVDARNTIYMMENPTIGEGFYDNEAIGLEDAELHLASLTSDLMEMNFRLHVISGFYADRYFNEYLLPKFKDISDRDLLGGYYGILEEMAYLYPEKHNQYTSVYEELIQRQYSSEQRPFLLMVLYDYGSICEFFNRPESDRLKQKIGNLEEELKHIINDMDRLDDTHGINGYYYFKGKQQHYWKMAGSLQDISETESSPAPFPHSSKPDEIIYVELGKGSPTWSHHIQEEIFDYYDKLLQAMKSNRMHEYYKTTTGKEDPYPYFHFPN